jgi:hypothetical protein
VARLRTELLYGYSWPKREGARTAIFFEYLEGFCKRYRLHWALGYRSPVDLEEAKMRESTAA